MRRFAPTVVLYGLLLILAAAHREVLAETFAQLAHISVWSVGGLLVLTFLVVYARGYLLAASTPGLQQKRAMKVDQIALAAAYGIVVGGGPVGVAAKVTMFRKWGISSSNIATSLVATAVVPTFTTWGLAVVVHTPEAIRGTATTAESLAVVVGTATICFSAVFWTCVCLFERPVKVIAFVGERIRRTLLKVIPMRFVRIRETIGAVQPHLFLEAVRLQLRELFRVRGFRIVQGALFVPFAAFLTLLFSLRVSGATEISVVEALSAFALVRVIVSLSPIPGGVGLAEIGLVSLLTTAGATEVHAAGATMLYRAVTWLAPMVIGGLGWWRWRRDLRNEKFIHTTEAHNGEIHDKTEVIAIT